MRLNRSNDQTFVASIEVNVLISNANFLGGYSVLKRYTWLSIFLILLSLSIVAEEEKGNEKEDNTLFTLNDIFSLEYASDPVVSSDGKRVYFTRHFMDRHKDKSMANIWSVDIKTKELRPVTAGNHKDYSPVLSSDGKRLAYISTSSGSSQIFIHWLDTGTSAKISNLSSGPSGLSWSPDGKWLAFSMFVKGEPKSVVNLPGKPEGAEWAKPATYIDKVLYRFDGSGYVEPGFTQIFVMPANGGSPRQITHDDFDHGGQLSWSKDSKSIYFSANRDKRHELQPINSEIFRVSIDDGEIKQLTERNGPDASPLISPSGSLLAYVGYDDKYTNYENVDVYIMQNDGRNPRNLTEDLDRSVGDIQWAPNSKGVYFSYNDQGSTVLAYQPLKGKRKIISNELGGLAIGRPYTSAKYHVGKNGTVAFTRSNPERPAEIAIDKSGKTITLTQLSDAGLGHKNLGKMEEVWYKSSADDRDIHGWIVYPPNFDATKKYPLILEIHGGPVAAYGPHFAAEIQLYAAQGYVVLYTNPRGSESYGKEFAHTIHHNYPSQDYDDLMSGVDMIIGKGFIDETQLFVTGGSGGGVLTSWIIGHTDRFAAAVVAKPVINWYSFVLTADFYPFFYRYWFGKKPWEDMENYMRRSPISYVGNVTTPTMLLTGESDYRTPISETEQYYQALKLQEVESALVRIPGAGHGIYKRPSNLMSKVAHILWWFEKYHPQENEEKNEKEKKPS